MKTILFVMQRPPYLDTRVFEAIDALLVAAAFEQQVTVLFRGAGIQQLLAGQAPQNQRNLAKILTSLPTYDVHAIHVAATALDRFGLARDELAIDVEPLDDEAIAALINAHDVVLTD